MFERILVPLDAPEVAETILPYIVNFCQEPNIDAVAIFTLSRYPLPDLDDTIG
jgi:hypothetical protein